MKAKVLITTINIKILDKFQRNYSLYLWPVFATYRLMEVTYLHVVWQRHKFINTPSLYSLLYRGFARAAYKYLVVNMIWRMACI